MRSLAVSMGTALLCLAGSVCLAGSAAAMPSAPSPAFAPDATPGLTRVEYFCSPGFVPSYGGQCVATMARDEVEIYVNEPVEALPPPPHRRHRHALHERY